MVPSRSTLLRRLADADTTASAGPRSYNKAQHSFEAVIATASPVARVYGTEVLRISPQAVDLSRLREGSVPLLDSHQQSSIDNVIGRMTSANFDRGVLVGKFIFAQTPAGMKAEAMVARGEITGVSAGYRVDRWEISASDGKIVDEAAARWDDELTFTATRWALFECSLVSVPADSAAMIRSLGGQNDDEEVRNVLARARARQAIIDREQVRNVFARMKARQAIIERQSKARRV